jgi:hypothetical protein
MATLTAWSTFANTIITALIGLVAGYVAYQAYGATQGQYREAREANRPWMKADAKLSTGFFERPYSNTDRDYSIVLNVELKNVGKSPALNVRVKSQAYIGAENGPALDRMMEAQRAACFKATTPDGFVAAETFFPDQAGWNLQIAAFPRDQWNASLKKDEPQDLAYILGCVLYQDGYRDEHHTPFAYLIAHSEPPGPNESLYWKDPYKVKKKLKLLSASDARLLTPN